jgi:hypothetical protein
MRILVAHHRTQKHEQDALHPPHAAIRRQVREKNFGRSLAIFEEVAKFVCLWETFPGTGGLI